MLWFLFIGISFYHIIYSGKCNAIKDRFKLVHKNLEEKEQKENLPSSVNESLLQNQE